ncbi:hypothetical protein BHM03_00051341, partial [Ensete ventricosum]
FGQSQIQASGQGSDDAVGNSHEVHRELVESIKSLPRWRKGVHRKKIETRRKKTETHRKIVGGSRKAYQEFNHDVEKELQIKHGPRIKLRHRAKVWTMRWELARSLLGLRQSCDCREAEVHNCYVVDVRAVVLATTGVRLVLLLDEEELLKQKREGVEVENTKLGRILVPARKMTSCSSGCSDAALWTLIKGIEQALRGDLYDMLELSKEQATARVLRPRLPIAKQWVCQQLYSAAQWRPAHCGFW